VTGIVHEHRSMDAARFPVRVRRECGVYHVWATFATPQQSFVRYEGQWTLHEQDGHTLIGYELLAEPGFDAPEFMLTHLLRREVDQMIERLQAEIAARAAVAARP
jgi:hypothetical protein